MTRRPYQQVRASKLRRYERMMTRFKFLIADNPGHPNAPLWGERLAYFEKCMTYHGDSPYLLAHDNNLADKLQLRIYRLEYLAQFYRAVNRAYRQDIGFDGIILTRYWRETIEKNLQEFGVPVPEKWFWRVRTLLAHYRKRLKKLNNSVNKP